MSYKYPKNFARFYDLIYHSIRDGVDNDYFLTEMEHTNGRILEVGVGTGRFFMDSLLKGNDVYGIDISESMLEILSSKLEPSQQKRISLQNIVDFHFDIKFDLIIAPFRVFMHVMEIEDQLQALSNVHNHLNPGGKFIFDVFVPDLDQLKEGLNKKVDFEADYEPGRKVRRIVSTSPDLIAQLINIEFRIEWEEEDGIKHEDWDFALRIFFRYELEHLIRQSPFDEFKIFGNYQKNDLDANSKEFIVQCQKNESSK